MSRPTARVLALLEILQTGGVHTLASLAERLGVDARTVRRYVDHLIDLDVPVESIRGRYGGYRLARGFRMPPLMLTDDEAVATLLGLITAQRAGLGAPAAADTAAAKLRRVLPHTLGRKLNALLETTRFTAGTEGPVTAPESKVLLTVAEAASSRRPIEMRYRSTRRELHPYGLVAHSGRWYVAGKDSSSGEVRTFRIDRIEDLKVLPGEFDQPESFDPAAHVLTGLAKNPWTHDVRLRVQATEDHIRKHFKEEIAIIEQTDGDWQSVSIQAQHLDWIPPRLAALDRPFKIDSPEELREITKALADRMRNYAERRR